MDAKEMDNQDWQDFARLLTDIAGSLITLSQKADGAQRQDLQVVATELTKISSECLNKAGALLLEDAATSVAVLKEQTKKANEAIKTITDIKKAIDIATIVLKIAGSVLKKNPSSIIVELTALKNLTEKKGG